MGTDKVFLRLGTRTLLEHQIATIAQVSDRFALVGDTDRLQPYGPVVEDRFPGQGPLAGIQAALTSQFAADLNLIVAVDIPAIKAELLKYLFKVAASASAAVVVPRSRGQVQPLSAVYRREFAPVAEHALSQQRNKIDHLFSEVSTRVIAEDELKALGFAADIFDNVNTPEDWVRVQAKLKVTDR